MRLLSYPEYFCEFTHRHYEMIDQAIFCRVLIETMPKFLLNWKDINALVVTSNLHETTLHCFEKICFKVKENGKLDILLLPVVLVPSRLEIKY